jgi:subtilisin family serine protease
MSPRVISAIAVVAAVLGCETSIPVIGIPTHLAMVSGSDQTADVGATLADPLVVQALDGANHQLKNITIKWTVATGGGSLSADSSITDATGQASVQWTLGPEPGAQSVTATAAGFDGAAATFLASNGSVITGTVAIANSSPTSLFVLRSAGASGLDRSALDDGSMAARQPRFSDRGIVVLFRGDVLRVASAGSGAYRSQAVARSVAHTLAQHLASVTRGLPVRGARVSPAILAAHLDIADTSRVNDVLAALRADPAVSRADRDVIISIRDGAPRPQAARLPPAVFGTTAAGRAANTLLPNDPAYYAEAWGPGMVDLPRAWAITTGSASVTVAVVDMGVRFEDPELAGNLSSDGYDFVSQITLASLGYDSIGHYCGGGADFTTIDGDGDGPDANPSDPDDIYLDSLGTCWSHNDLGDHGQWTSGIIGAVSNNNYGVTGVNWSVRVRPVRVLGITGEGSAFDVAQGVLYAAGLPAVGANDTLVTAPSRAPIVNMSLGSPADDASLSSAVAAAVQQGCLVVASAGNQTWDLPTYPAAYPGVLGVSAVGMDGQIASYSNGGSYVGLAAPGGEFRLDDNGGDGVLGLGWDFVAGQPVFLFGYGTSAAAPYVSGVAALLLAKDAGLSAADLTSRLEQYASRPVNATRDDNYGWGIVDAYNALTQKPGPARSRYVELFDAAGAVARSAQADSNGAFALADLEPGTYNLVAGEDEDGDGTIGVPGRRFGVAGGVASPLALQVLSSATLLRAAVTIGVPMESEPNDQIANANLLEVGTYVVGTITPPDVQDVYAVPIPASGQYTFETSGVVGSCGWGIELDTRLSLSDSNGTVLDVNDNAGAFTGPYCSKLTGTASPGTLYITVTGSSADGLADHGRYRLQVRSGP